MLLSLAVQSTLLLLSSLATADSSSSSSSSLTTRAEGKGADGLVIGHLSPACSGTSLKKKKPLSVPVDKCLSTPNFAIEIKSLALCSNGSIAQIARFPAKRCGHGVLDDNFGLKALSDSDEGTCMTMLEDSTKIESVAFWCEGVAITDPADDPKEPEKKKDAKGSVSESACASPRKAPFYNHPKTDTCVDFKTDKMQIYSMGVCGNDTTPSLALWGDRGCGGVPDEMRTIEEDEMKKCLDFEGAGSWALWCEGNVKAPKGKPNNNGGGSIWGFLLILLLIFLFSILALVLSVLAWVRRYGGSVGQVFEMIKNVFTPKDRGIAL